MHLTNIFPSRHSKESFLLSEGLDTSLGAQMAFLIQFTERVFTRTAAISFNMRERRSAQAGSGLANANNCNKSPSKVQTD